MSKSQSSKKLFKSRTVGRLRAVQALFQIEQTGALPSTVVVEFITHRLRDAENVVLKFDTSFFTKLVEGTWRLREESDVMIRETLKAGWSLDRIEPVTRAILRTAFYELSETQTPSAVIINEYLNITHDFFNDGEVAFVNGVLNTIVHKIRPSSSVAS